jgi:hypothetical protein
MTALHTQARTLAAVATLESDRAEARTLFGTQGRAAPADAADSFPRSRTFRWLLGHPLGRWVGSAVITGVLARLPLGRFVGSWLLRRET